MKFLIFGGKGWIGTYFCNYVKDTNPQIEIIHALSRADNEIDAEKEIVLHKPNNIISFVGRTRGGNYSTIDYLEQKGKLCENIRDNLYAPLILSLLGSKYKIHVTYLGTGCIFSGYPEKGYLESDKPDFFGSAYSTCKGFTDRIMHLMDNTVLNIRIRMPISNDLHPHNLLTKLMKYKNICDTRNSCSCLPDVIPIIYDMIIKNETGTINMTNPGSLYHSEILDMAKEILDPSLEWNIISEEEQAKIIQAERSKNYLNTDKLQKMYPSIPHIKDSIRRVLYEIKNKN